MSASRQLSDLSWSFYRRFTLATIATIFAVAAAVAFFVMVSVPFGLSAPSSTASDMALSMPVVISIICLLIAHIFGRRIIKKALTYLVILSLLFSFMNGSFPTIMLASTFAFILAFAKSLFAIPFTIAAATATYLMLLYLSIFLNLYSNYIMGLYFTISVMAGYLFCCLISTAILSDSSAVFSIGVPFHWWILALVALIGPYFSRSILEDVQLE